MTNAALKDVVIRRLYENKHGTFGQLEYNGHILCMTLELNWRDNLPNVSRIPAGVYPARKHTGPRFKDVWIFDGVPDRQAILIHAGNTIKDTQGCILVGNTHSPSGVLYSQDALRRLREVLPPEFRAVVMNIEQGE